MVNKEKRLWLHQTKQTLRQKLSLETKMELYKDLYNDKRVN